MLDQTLFVLPASLKSGGEGKIKKKRDINGSKENRVDTDKFTKRDGEGSVDSLKMFDFCHGRPFVPPSG